MSDKAQYKLLRDVSLGGGMSWKAGEILEEARARKFRSGGRRSGRTNQAMTTIAVARPGKPTPYAEIAVADLEPYTPPPPPTPPELLADETWGAF